MGVIDDLAWLAENGKGGDIEIIALEASDEIHALRATVRVLTEELTDCRRKQEQRKPCGPLGKVELRKQMNELFGALYQCETDEDVDDIEAQYSTVLRQCEVDLPEYMEGINGQPELGYHARKQRVLELCRQ